MRIQKTTATFFVTLAGALPMIAVATAGFLADSPRVAFAIGAQDSGNGRGGNGGVDWRTVPGGGDLVPADGGVTWGTPAATGFTPTGGGVTWRTAAGGDGGTGGTGGGVEW